MSAPPTHLSGLTTHPQDSTPLQQSTTTKDKVNTPSSTSSSSSSPSNPPHYAPSPGTNSLNATPYRAATYGCSPYLASLLVFSAVILTCVIHSSFNHQLDPKGCIMTYMQPTYYRLQAFDETMTRFAGKYNLLLYRDGDYDDDRLRSPLNHIDFGGSNLVTQIESSVWAVDKSVKVSFFLWLRCFVRGR